MRTFVRPSSLINSANCVAALLLLTLTIGCGREPDIVQYTIDPAMPAALNTDTRMLGAIVPNGSDVWFYKLTGDVPATEQIDEQFRGWVASEKFVNGNPQLEMPEGWLRKPGSSMRYATIEIPAGEPPLEVSVSKLAKSDDWDSQVLDNVNRWRKQLGLEPSAQRWAGAVALTDEEGAEPGIWVDLVGQLDSSTSPGMPPFASQMGQPMGSPMEQPPAASQSPGKPPIEYEKPEQWEVGKTSSMRWASFSVGPKDKSAELTVIPAGGDLRGNIQRWLGQIRPDGVKDADVDAVISQASPVTVGGIESQRFLMTGTGDAPQSIDATIVPLGDGISLFIKMTGDSETVAAESERIQQFLDSLKLNS